MKGRTAAAAALLLVVTAGCGDGSSDRIADLEAQIADLEAQLEAATSTTTTTTAPTRLLTGTLTLEDPQGFRRPGDGSCSGVGGYDDLRIGAAVVVRDGAGVTVATANLSEGAVNQQGRCEWPFTVEVPDGLDFYAVEISHRGSVSFSAADLTAADWAISLSL